MLFSEKTRFQYIWQNRWDRRYLSINHSSSAPQTRWSCNTAERYALCEGNWTSSVRTAMFSWAELLRKQSLRAQHLSSIPNCFRNTVAVANRENTTYLPPFFCCRIFCYRRHVRVVILTNVFVMRKEKSQLIAIIDSVVPEVALFKTRQDFRPNSGVKLLVLFDHFGLQPNHVSVTFRRRHVALQAKFNF